MLTKPQGHASASEQPMTAQESAALTQQIIAELVAAGIPRDQIRVPGLAKHDIVSLPDDINEPLDEFADNR